MASLDEFIKVASSLTELQRQKDQVANDLESARQTLTSAVQEAEQKGRSIVEAAQAEATKILYAAQQKQKELQQREADVATRESAVQWVDVKLKELDEEGKQLAVAQSQAEQARIDAQAQQHYWVQKLDELKAREDVVKEKESAFNIAVTPA